MRPITRLLAALAAGLATTLVPARAQTMAMPSEPMASAADDTQAEHALKHLDPKYVCPMHPQIVQDEPGNCPICGMNLVAKVFEPPAASGHPEVRITPAIINSMGVRTAPVTRADLARQITSVGRVVYDETRLTHVHPRASGWMETLQLRAEGEPVRAGQTIGELFSKEILDAQVAFLIALEQRGGDVRLQNARNQLRLLGVPEATIARLEKERRTFNRVPIIAASSGIVMTLGVREGMYVTPQMEIATIADTRRAWVLVDVYEHQIDWLAEGLTAEIEVPAYPGKRWRGTLDYIYPELDPVSRTLPVRLVFDNPDDALKANMFARAIIHAPARSAALTVPAEAIIETGARSTVVRALGDGRFQPVDVSVGLRSEGRAEILDGLSADDTVVVSGQFLIDSESSLKASFTRMTEPQPAPAMDMSMGASTDMAPARANPMAGHAHH